MRAKKRYRSRKILGDMFDFASNDYLALAHSKTNAKKAFDIVLKSGSFGAKASQLVNGYGNVHAYAEELLAKTFAFESCVLFGSGYLANLALAGNLPRKNDLILMDEEYHASGKVGVKLSGAKCEFFKHNDAADLRQKLQHSTYDNTFIFIESVYSMIGDIVNKDVIRVAEEFNAWIIIDDAHGLGNIGEDMLGIDSIIKITKSERYIKMGTFSKALGSYGAYVLCSDVVSKYLQNRASSLIYTTAPSLFDTAFAIENFKTILHNGCNFANKLQKRRKSVEKALNIELQTQIFMFSKNARQAYEILLQKNICVGFIRPPTIASESLRITLRIGENEKTLKILCNVLKTVK